MKNNKGFVPILMIVAILAVLAVGGVVYYTVKNSKTTLQNTQTNNSQLQANQNSVSNIFVPSNTKTQTSETNDASNGKYIGYIKSISTKDGKGSLVIDYVQWINCTSDSSGSCPDDYKIVNNNPLLRTFPISDNVTVTINVDARPVVSSLPSLISTINNLHSGNGDLCNIILNNGVVTDITEVYTP